MKQHQKQQKIIRLGTHGEDYGSWMSNPVFYMIGGLLTLSAVLAALSFSMFHIAALGILFSVAAAALLALLIWCAWIRKQYAFGGGGMMERVHQVVLSHLDFEVFIPRIIESAKLKIPRTNGREKIFTFSVILTYVSFWITISPSGFLTAVA